MQPVPGHQGAHGAFDSRAKDGSWELGLTMHASWLATTLSGAAGVVVRKLAGDQASGPSSHSRQSSNGQRGHHQQPVPAHQ